MFKLCVHKVSKKIENGEGHIIFKLIMDLWQDWLSSLKKSLTADHQGLHGGWGNEKKKTEESPKRSISLFLFDLLELVPCFSSLHVIFHIWYYLSDSHAYMYVHVKYKKTKRNSLKHITWPTLGKQNIKLKRSLL